jgi:hypothetical protein
MTDQDSLNNIGVNFRGSISGINKNCVFAIILILFFYPVVTGGFFPRAKRLKREAASPVWY